MTFKRAHQITKPTVAHFAKFGFKISYQATFIATIQELKMDENFTPVYEAEPVKDVTAALKAIGGKEWKGTRIYFNDLENFYGLECCYYKTGNISSAKVDGEAISNSKARETLGTLRTAKVWFDIESKEFCYESRSDKTIKKVVREIKRLAGI